MVLYYRMPFDFKTPIGYLIANAVLYSLLKCIYFYAAVGSSINIGAWLFVMKFIEDIQNDTKSINKIAKSKKNQSKLLNRLSDSIQFHSNTKELSI